MVFSLERVDEADHSCSKRYHAEERQYEGRVGRFKVEECV